MFILNQTFFERCYRPEQLSGFVVLDLKAVKQVKAFGVKFVEGSWKWLGNVEAIAATSWRH
jgi:hypothetical protein